MGELKKLLNRVIPLLLALLLLLSCVPLTAQAATKNYMAEPYSKKILVNGTSITARMYEINYKATIYVKVRDNANAVKKTDKKFSVTYDTKKNTLTIKPGKSYTTVGGENKKSDGKNARALDSSTKFYKNSTKQTAKAYVIDKESYVALTSLAKIANFSLTNDSKKKAYVINTKYGYGEPTTPITPTPTGGTTGILKSPFPKAALITALRQLKIVRMF